MNIKPSLNMPAAVAQGQAKPLIRAPQICPAIHGDSGLEFHDGGSMQVHLTAGQTMQRARCGSTQCSCAAYRRDVISSVRLSCMTAPAP